MPSKAKELDNRYEGDRSACPICNPPNPKKRVTASQVWAATQKYGGRSHRTFNPLDDDGGVGSETL